MMDNNLRCRTSDQLQCCLNPSGFLLFGLKLETPILHQLRRYTARGCLGSEQERPELLDKPRCILR